MPDSTNPSRVHLERNISDKLKALGEVCDQGLLAGGVERREAKRLLRDISMSLFTLRGLSFADRAQSREEVPCAPNDPAV